MNEQCAGCQEFSSRTFQLVVMACSRYSINFKYQKGISASTFANRQM